MSAFLNSGRSIHWKTPKSKGCFWPGAEITLLLRLGLILACTPVPRLFQRDPNKVDGGVTSVSGFVFVAQVNGVHPTDCAVFSNDS